VEVQPAGLEVELRIAFRNRLPFLVRGDEAEVRFPAQIRIGTVCTRGRVNPATTGDETTVGVVEDDEVGGYGASDDNVPIWDGYRTGGFVVRSSLGGQTHTRFQIRRRVERVGSWRFTTLKQDGVMGTEEST
jgi:hypothetical protein